MLTDDPDILLEGLADSPSGSMTDPNLKPPTSTEINHDAEEIGGNEAGADIVADQMELQKEIEKQQQVEHQRIVEPQLNNLQDALGDIGNGIMQGQQQTTAGNQAFQGLDKELAGVNTLLAGLEKTL